MISRRRMIDDMLRKCEDRAMLEGGWYARHVAAWQAALRPGDLTHAGTIVKAICLLAGYADAHAARYDSDIADDPVLGAAWKSWGDAIIGLLNGETGGLDCGTLDALIRRMGATTEP